MRIVGLETKERPLGGLAGVRSFYPVSPVFFRSIEGRVGILEHLIERCIRLD